MKVADLEGEALDIWVARAVGQPIKRHRDGFLYTDESHFRQWDPSSCWLLAGPIIEREGIAIWKRRNGWEADLFDPVAAIEMRDPHGAGPRPLIAAMRAFVVGKFGREVDDTPQLD